LQNITFWSKRWLELDSLDKENQMIQGNKMQKSGEFLKQILNESIESNEEWCEPETSSTIFQSKILSPQNYIFTSSSITQK